MFQTAVLFSGSKGNSVLVRTENAALLLDAGVSAKRIFSAMEELGVSRFELKAIVISHEHSDHTKGVGPVSRLLKIPVYANEETFYQCEERLGRLDHAPRIFETGTAFQIGDIIVHPFSSSHDAVDSCNFIFHKDDGGDRKLGVALDLGYPSNLTVNKLQGCSTLILESNHDFDMLISGSYEWHLKQRIKSDNGHLSNQQAVGLVSQILHSELKQIVLAHLSEENNEPELAHRTMSDFLKGVRSDTKLLVADQYKSTPLINI